MFDQSPTIETLDNTDACEHEQTIPDSLAEFFGFVPGEPIDFRLIDPKDYALVIIDVQKAFCDPNCYDKEQYNEFSDGLNATSHTDKMAGEIDRITKLFRKHSIPVIIVYYGNKDFSLEENDKLHRLTEEDTDIPVIKNDDCAFSSSNLDDVLEDVGTSSFFLMGGNISSCAGVSGKTGLRRGYNIAVLSDGVYEDGMAEMMIPAFLNSLKEAGAVITDSSTILDTFDKTLA